MANSRNRPPPEGFVHRLSAVLADMAVGGRHLCVGLSGGVDSVALLLGLHSLKSALGFELSALHVNHGLSAHADAWQAHCVRLCQSLSIPLNIHRVNVSRDDPRGLEAAARQARYAAFSGAGADCIVLAHHLGDQAETVLFRLLRGAGVKGCAAMRAQSVWGRQHDAWMRVLRPLLGFSKTELEQFVAEHEQSWVTDDSNNDTQFARNFLRAEILPRLNQKFPAAEKVLSRAAELFAETGDLLADLAQIDLDCVRHEEGLRIDALRALGESRVRNLLRYLMDRFGMILPDRDRLAELVRQVLTAREDRELMIPVGDGWLARFDGMLHFLRQVPGEPGDDMVWTGQAHLDWAGGRIDFSRCVGEGVARSMIENQAIRIAPRGGGERIAVSLNRPRRTLKQLYQEHRVPPWLRAAMPLVWCGESLIAVGDVALDPRFACPPGENGLKIGWQPPDMLLSLSRVALS